MKLSELSAWLLSIRVFPRRQNRLTKFPQRLAIRLKKLEETFGVELFIRKGRYIELTPAGEYFIHHSKTILDDLDALKRNTALVYEGVERELTVAVNNIVAPAALVEFIAAFDRAFPSTQLKVNTEVYNGCWDALYSKRADLAIGAPIRFPALKALSVSRSLRRNGKGSSVGR